MDTFGGDANTTIGHLFAEPAATTAPASAPVNEQPAPPDVEYGQLPPIVEPQPQDQQVAPGQEPPAPAPQQQSHMVPLAELIDTRKRAQAAEEAARQTQREMQQLREMIARQSQPQPQAPQPQPIDPVEDPQGFANAIHAQIENRFLNQALNESERRARTDFGGSAVDAALEAAQQAGFAQAFVNRPDAYREMVEWHQAQQLRTQVGSNPAAYLEQMKAQVRAQVLAELKQGSAPTNLPPSLAGATRANNAPEVISSDRDFFRETMNPRRQRG